MIYFKLAELRHQHFNYNHWDWRGRNIFGSRWNLEIL